ncbi:hypothetical protein TRFO_05128 [Tritrichomonas foetus]|uniref:PSP1 C-terminal domain-containing protein n=1 Tax=Tritrichomonas foetus TaxID=1144522 RepID=A0A1J4K7Q3_9EUKA|nr:hypothetical protein TRFO_05128 [Tritrichomonas foetus]|eukprot:OHT07513.1 hypothetical protein TRFO_05128 [Tritrichomonas foetus]
MTQSWELFLDEGENDLMQSQGPLLPSILRDVISDNNEDQAQNNELSKSIKNIQHNELHENKIHIESLRSFPNVTDIPKRPRSIPPPDTFFKQNPINPIKPSEYYFVQFHQNRTLLVKNTPLLQLDDTDYVITEADRGFDLGKIIKNELHPLEKDAITARSIIRKATTHEISMIPSKVDKEIKAREICQEKANELGLPMKITATELQFDGKKLTVYFSATQYIDFRNLVHTLFRVFGTRIWMVWFDGNAPVRDVFTHHARDRRLTLE